MAVAFVAAGAFNANANASTVNLTAPTCSTNDILICQLASKSATTNTISAPDGTWTQITQGISDCTTAADDHEYALFWKRATGSGGSFAFTKATNDSLTFGGVISAWSGCPTSGSPLDATTVAVQTNVGAADDVTFPAFDPTRTDTEVLFFAFYGNDLTTFAAAMSADTNPDCTTRYDLETTAGTDFSMACASGSSDGSNIASRTWASASTADSGSTGIVLALIPSGGGSVDGTATPSAVALTDTVPAPTAGGGGSTSPSAMTLALTIPHPNFDSDFPATAITLSVTVPAPTVTGQINISTSPAAVALTVTVPASTGSGDANVFPAAMARPVTTPHPNFDSNIAPAAVARTVVVPAPTVTGQINISTAPAAVALTVTTAAPTGSGGSNTSPAAVARAVTTPQPTFDSSITPAAVALTAVTPTATGTGTSAPTPAAVALTVTVPVPTVSGSSGVAPAAVALTVTIPAPTATGTSGGTATPAAVAISVDVGAAVASFIPPTGAQALPATLALTVDIGVAVASFIPPPLTIINRVEHWGEPRTQMYSEPKSLTVRGG